MMERKNTMSRFVARLAMAVIAAYIGLAQPAHAFQLYFKCLGEYGNCDTGEQQLEVEVADSGDGNIALIFTNNGSAPSAIASVYIDDERGTLSGPPKIHQDAPDVIFDLGVSPTNLPGGAKAAPSFSAESKLSVSAGSPHRSMGVNPGEQLGLIYPLSPGRTFEDVVADLSVGNLRLGVHVVGFASKGPQSFISQQLLTETIARR